MKKTVYKKLGDNFDNLGDLLFLIECVNNIVSKFQKEVLYEEYEVGRRDSSGDLFCFC